MNDEKQKLNIGDIVNEVKEEPKHAGGRPSIYSDEIIKKAKEYIDDCEDEEEQQMIGLSAKGTEMFKIKTRVHIPSIEGLALYLDVHKDTLYEWEKEHKEFSDILAILRSKQANALIEKGLSGDYNSTIAKLLLSKHGYVEAKELTGKDGKDLIPEENTQNKADQAINIYLDGKRINNTGNNTEEKSS